MEIQNRERCLVAGLYRGGQSDAGHLARLSSSISGGGARRNRNSPLLTW